MTISTIRKRLLQVEESFLDASNPLLVEDFGRTWNTLVVDVLKAINANQMTQEDIALADAVSSRIASLCKTFAEFTNACDDISLSLEQNLQRIHEKHNHGNHHFRPRSSEEMLHPTSAPYIKRAYSWLMQNLSNPYPPKEIREAIARKAGSDPKHVENWFGDARKRMGWNAIRKHHFSNKRRLTVAAATAFFGGLPSKLLTDPVRQDFAAMLADAGDMYSKRFIESKLARQIDGVTGFPKDNRSQPVSVEGESSLSPCQSIFHSFLQSQCRSRKRPRLLDSVDDDLDANRPRQRPRVCNSDQKSPTSLHSTLHEALPCPSSPVPSDIPATFQKKRQTSESENQWPLRHSSRDPGLVCLQTASDPTRTSFDPSSSSTLPFDVDVLDDLIVSQQTIHEAAERKDLVNTAHSQQYPMLHYSAYSIPSPSLPPRKENTQLSLELQTSAPRSNSVVTPGLGLALPDSDVPYTSLFTGPAVDEHFLDMSSSESTSRSLSSAQDVTGTSWPSTIANNQADGQFFGYFDCLPIDSTFAAQVNALPTFADVDLTFGNLFDLDASGTFPPSDPHLDGIFPVDGVGGLAADNMLTLTPTVDNSMVKLAQLEQLKKRRNRIQEHIDSLELQIEGTPVA